jgi:hypothetical protein
VCHATRGFRQSGTGNTFPADADPRAAMSRSMPQEMRSLQIKLGCSRVSSAVSRRLPSCSRYFCKFARCISSPSSRVALGFTCCFSLAALLFGVVLRFYQLGVSIGLICHSPSPFLVLPRITVLLFVVFLFTSSFP